MVETRFDRKLPAAGAIADILAGAWRPAPPPPFVSAAELEEALPMIARTNAAALCWWRLRDGAYARLPGVEVLHDAYRYVALEARLHEMRLQAVLRALRAASIEPILIKGWSVARLYPDTGLRPYEDIDLHVRPDQKEPALAALAASDAAGAIVDFDHAEITVYDSGDWDGLYARSRTVDLAGTAVRVLSPEDHLRAICIHGLKHCFSNPLWLCDVAVSVEAAGREFDWTRCFGNRRPQDQWIACALGIARELLGCELPEDAAKRVGRLPRWLVPIVLDTWVRWAVVGAGERRALGELFDNPASVAAIVARRWPNQLAVSLGRGAPLNDDPLWLQRVQQFQHLFAAKRLLQALLRDKPERSTP